MSEARSSLPPELLLKILSDPELDLVDLARVRLVSPSLASISRLVAKTHTQRELICAVLGECPADVLCIAQNNVIGETGWIGLVSKEDINSQTQKIWDRFADRDLEAGIQDLIPLARFFASLAAYTHRFNGGFPETSKGSLPSDTAPHRLLLLLHALLYSLIRCLTRRVRHSAGKSQEIHQYSELLGIPEERLHDAPELEHRLRQEYKELKKALLVVDPLHSHICGDTGIHCRCSGRSHASWYMLCWHHLTVRYRRFLTPSDVDHVAFRTIYFAVPAFPSTETSPFLSSDYPGAVNGATHVRLPTGPAAPWTFSLPGDLPTTSATSLPGPHGPPLLNPDSLLFSLSPSPTAEQSKGWYGLSEFALPAGAARLWAGWIGYSWAEGGLYWHDKAQSKAEKRLSTRGAERDDSGDGTGRATDADEQGPMLPVERVLLAHARWRARTLLLQRDSFPEVMQIVPHQHSQGVGHDDRSAISRQNAILLSQQSAFDWHFLSRALQIQQWALRGWSNAGGPEAGGGGSLYDEGGRIPGQVTRTSPFEVIFAPRTDQESKSPDGRKNNLDIIVAALAKFITKLLRHSASPEELARTKQVTSELETAERWCRAWRAIEEPLRPFLSFSVSKNDDAISQTSLDSSDDRVARAWAKAKSQENRVLMALGDLYGGLSPQGHRLDSLLLCNESPEMLLDGRPTAAIDSPSISDPATSPRDDSRFEYHFRAREISIPSRGLSAAFPMIKTIGIIVLVPWLVELVMGRL